MSWGSHSCSLESAIINIQALSVLWLKYHLNINKTSISMIWFYFLQFFIVKKDQGTFFNDRIRFYFYPIRLRIDTRTRRQKEKLTFILQMNRTEPLIVTASNWAAFSGQQLIGWLLLKLIRIYSECEGGIEKL